MMLIACCEQYIIVSIIFNTGSRELNYDIDKRYLSWKRIKGMTETPSFNNLV